MQDGMLMTSPQSSPQHQPQHQHQYQERVPEAEQGQQGPQPLQWPSKKVVSPFSPLHQHQHQQGTSEAELAQQGLYPSHLSMTHKEKLVQPSPASASAQTVVMKSVADGGISSAAIGTPTATSATSATQAQAVPPQQFEVSAVQDADTPQELHHPPPWADVKGFADDQMLHLPSLLSLMSLSPGLRGDMAHLGSGTPPQPSATQLLRWDSISPSRLDDDTSKPAGALSHEDTGDNMLVDPLPPSPTRLPKLAANAATSTSEASAEMRLLYEPRRRSEEPGGGGEWSEDRRKLAERQQLAEDRALLVESIGLDANIRALELQAEKYEALLDSKNAEARHARELQEKDDELRQLQAELRGTRDAMAGMLSPRTWGSTTSSSPLTRTTTTTSYSVPSYVSPYTSSITKPVAPKGSSGRGV
ncbi:hypothetical protein CYMTET_13411 [Cymbomonas tetramitiformis]|uniref:Uncharacterized protein n=1 Tax=Cymbomonas tetramitiformis TaxID=36881 RepID=A0AAE0GIH2_9CHLO|nr:hypothetical protein CYMTET_13411 [Cymbomonas tetramitiformis]